MRSRKLRQRGGGAPYLGVPAGKKPTFAIDLHLKSALVLTPKAGKIALSDLKKAVDNAVGAACDVYAIYKRLSSNALPAASYIPENYATSQQLLGASYMNYSVLYTALITGPKPADIATRLTNLKNAKVGTTSIFSSKPALNTKLTAAVLSAISSNPNSGGTGTPYAAAKTAGKTKPDYAYDINTQASLVPVKPAQGSKDITMKVLLAAFKAAMPKHVVFGVYKKIVEDKIPAAINEGETVANKLYGSSKSGYSVLYTVLLCSTGTTKAAPTSAELSAVATKTVGGGKILTTAPVKNPKLTSATLSGAPPAAVGTPYAAAKTAGKTKADLAVNFTTQMNLTSGPGGDIKKNSIKDLIAAFKTKGFILFALYPQTAGAIDQAKYIAENETSDAKLKGAAAVLTSSKYTALLSGNKANVGELSSLKTSYKIGGSKVLFSTAPTLNTVATDALSSASPGNQGNQGNEANQAYQSPVGNKIGMTVIDMIPKPSTWRAFQTPHLITDVQAISSSGITLPSGIGKAVTIRNDAHGYIWGIYMAGKGSNTQYYVAAHPATSNHETDDDNLEKLFATSPLSGPGESLSSVVNNPAAFKALLTKNIGKSDTEALTSLQTIATELQNCISAFLPGDSRIESYTQMLSEVGQAIVAVQNVIKAVRALPSAGGGKKKI